MKNLRNNTSKETIIFFSNPFGYGPTGTLIPIVKTFVQNLKNTRFIFAGSGLSKEIWDQSVLNKIEIFDLDERNYDEVKNFLTKFPSCRVVCVLNKFVTLAASELGIDCALVDPLGWFWTTQMPKEFLKASIYFPNNLNKKLPAFTKTFDTPLIVGSGINKIKSEVKDLIVFHLGGSQYPVTTGISTDYLDLIAELINGIDKSIKNKLIVAGGKNSTNYLRKVTFGVKKIGSFPLEEFNDYLDRAEKFVTLAGMGATFTAIYKCIPTSIFLPQNLSQLALSNVLNEMSLVEKTMDWNSYTSLPSNILDLTENEGIMLINDIAKQVHHSVDTMELARHDFQSLFDVDKSTVQSKMVDNIKFGGENFIYKKLVTEWKL